MRFTLRSDVLKAELGFKEMQSKKYNLHRTYLYSQQRGLGRVGRQRRHPHANHKRDDVVNS